MLFVFCPIVCSCVHSDVAVLRCGLILIFETIVSLSIPGHGIWSHREIVCHVMLGGSGRQMRGG